MHLDHASGVLRDIKMRYYDPETNTEAFPELHKNASKLTPFDGIPSASQEWFSRAARDGYEWKCLNGVYPEEIEIPPPSEEEILNQQYQQWKAERSEAVKNITVNVDGMIFNGDEISQERMTRIVVLATDETEKINWILANNTSAPVTPKQLNF